MIKHRLIVLNVHQTDTSLYLEIMLDLKSDVTHSTLRYARTQDRRELHLDQLLRISNETLKHKHGKHSVTIISLLNIAVL